MFDEEVDPFASYRRVNVDGSLRLAHEAALAGVRRIVYLSSIKVNGERTESHPFRECDPPAPEDLYGMSKLEAEIRLTELCSRSGLQLVILRPPLVYGAGVKGNLLRLMRAIDRGYPLPIGAIQNRRSLLAADNLVSSIVCCLDHPRATGSTFLVADDPPLSSPDLARAVAGQMRRPARLISVPLPILRFTGRILKRSAAVDRLTSSLVVDGGKIRRELGWRPLCSFEQGIKDMVRAYMDTR
jgi:nucleoside-diphosphate-sugar epimerase